MIVNTPDGIHAAAESEAHGVKAERQPANQPHNGAADANNHDPRRFVKLEDDGCTFAARTFSVLINMGKVPLNKPPSMASSNVRPSMLLASALLLLQWLRRCNLLHCCERRIEHYRLWQTPRPLASLYTYIALHPAHDFGRFHRFSLCL